MEVRIGNYREYIRKETIVHQFTRSRLYNLIPVETETPWIESLTSFINRLAWKYRIAPRILVAQEIVPHLSKSYYFQSSPHLLGAFCRSQAMSINGAGEVTLDWSDTLTRLTMRKKLRDLTLGAWAGEIPSKGLLRVAPAWCPVCYSEWQEEGYPIYQPLLWMLQVMTVCLRHMRPMEERCPHCQKKQSVIAARMRPGCCTQCMTWLGIPSSPETENEVDEETREWQQWVLDVIGELRKAGTSTGCLPLEQLTNGLALCVEIVGSAKHLAQLAGIPKQLLSSWLNHKQIPSFERILELCYVLNITPLQLMTNSAEILKEILRKKEIHRQPRPRHVAPHQVNREQALALIRAVLDGREAPMGVRWLERRLGLGARTLIYHFPQECALMSTQYQAYRTEQARKRREQGCSEIRQTTLKLFAEGTHPSAQRVTSRLPEPGIMRKREGLTAWHSARRELGLES